LLAGGAFPALALDSNSLQELLSLITHSTIYADKPGNHRWVNAPRANGAKVESRNCNLRICSAIVCVSV
jgi:hypothetical protein